eukprot:COSAG02_NODE_2502_length_8672_cov_3.830631_5_plen_871_part_00
MQQQQEEVSGARDTQGSGRWASDPCREGWCGSTMHAALPKSEWVKDTMVTTCEKCEKKFNQYRRKHHCRNCGHIFCWECSDLKYDLLVPAKNGGHQKDPKSLRVCHTCYDTLQDIEPAATLAARPRVSTIDAQRLDEREGRIAATNAEAQAEEWCAADGRRLQAPQLLPEAGWRTAREKSYFVVRNEQEAEMMLSVLTLPDRTTLSVKSKSSTTHLRSFLLELRHPFIAQTVDVGFGQPSADLACGQLFVLRQLTKGSLRDRIHGKTNPKHGCGKKYAKPGKPLREDKCALLGRQIIEGLAYLSKLGKDLGDLQMCAGLRASDVLLPSSNRACITDFENDLIGLEARPNGGTFAHTGPHAAALHAFSHIFFEMATGRELGPDVFADPLSHIPVTAPADVQQVLRELLQPEHGRKSMGEPLSPTRVLAMKLFSSIVYQKEESAAIFDISSDHTKKQRKRLRRVFCAAEDKAKKVKRQERLAQKDAAFEAENAERLAEPEPEPEPELALEQPAFELPAALTGILSEINSMTTDVFALVVEAAKSDLDGGAQAVAAQAVLPAIALQFEKVGMDPALAPMVHTGMTNLLKRTRVCIASITQEHGFDDEHGQDRMQVRICELLCPSGLVERHVVSIVAALDEGGDDSDDEGSDSAGQPQLERTATDHDSSDSSDSDADARPDVDAESDTTMAGADSRGSDEKPITSVAQMPKAEPELEPKSEAGPGPTAPAALDPIAEMQLRFLKKKVDADASAMRNSNSKPEPEIEPEPEPELVSESCPEPEPESEPRVVEEESAPSSMAATSTLPEGSPPHKSNKKRSKKKKQKKKEEQEQEGKPATQVSDLFGSSSDEEVAPTKRTKKKKTPNLFGSSSDED